MERKLAKCGKCGENYISGGRCKPCRNKRLQERRQAPRPCVDCGATIHRKHGEKRTRCGTCYPKHRKAVAALATIKDRCAKKGIACDLSLQWIKERYELPCPKTGVVYHMEGTGGYGDRSPYAPSIDKIDPHGGYTQDNCEMVCWFYNCAKQQFTHEEVVELCRLIVNQN